MTSRLRKLEDIKQAVSVMEEDIEDAEKLFKGGHLNEQEKADLIGEIKAAFDNKKAVIMGKDVTVDCSVVSPITSSSSSSSTSQAQQQQQRQCLTAPEAHPPISNALLSGNISQDVSSPIPVSNLGHSISGPSSSSTAGHQPVPQSPSNSSVQSLESCFSPGSAPLAGSKRKHKPRVMDVYVSIQETPEYEWSDKYRKKSAAETHSTIVADNKLREVDPRWLPKVWGKEENVEKFVYVNPDGKGYIKNKHPVLGEDYFLTPQDVLAFIAK